VTAPEYRSKRVRELAALKENWDSYGAPTLSQAALTEMR
jgi:hypothetical protein